MENSPGPDNQKTSRAQSQRKISNFLVLPRTQLKIIFGMSIFMSLMGISFCGVFWITIPAIFPPEIVGQLPPARIYMLPLFVAALIYVVCGIAYGVLLSHRIAGPIFHIMKVIRRVSEGDQSARAHFRPGDEFSELAKDFNTMMDKMN